MIYLPLQLELLCCDLGGLEGLQLQVEVITQGNVKVCRPEELFHRDWELARHRCKSRLQRSSLMHWHPSHPRESLIHLVPVLNQSFIRVRVQMLNQLELETITVPSQLPT